MRTVSTTCLVGLTILASAASAGAEVISFQDGAIEPFGAAAYSGTEDNLIVISTPAVGDRNYGGNADVLVGQDAGIPRRGLYRFDVSSLDGRFEKINSVTLRLNVYASAVSFSNQMDLYRLSAANESWVEGTSISPAQTGSSCWNYLAYDATSPTAWASGTPGTAAADYVPGGPVASTAYNASTPLGAFDLTFTDVSFIADWAADQNHNSGLLLRAQNQSNNSRLSLRSSEYAVDPAARPQLIIDYDPIIPRAAAAVLADGPEAYWRLNETVAHDTAVDATGNGHDFVYRIPTISSTPSRTGSEPDAGPRADLYMGFESFNNAPTLPGNENNPGVDDGYLGTPSGLLAGVDDYTAEMWFRRDGVGPVGMYLFRRADADAGAAAGDYFGLRDDPGDGESDVELVLYNGTSVVYADTHIEDNQWYHTAFVRDGDNVMVYLNGELELQTTLAFTAANWDNTGDWTIGGRTDFQTGGQEWSGNIDEIAIYGSALDAATIRAHFQAAVPEPSSAALLLTGLASLMVLGRRRKK